VKKPVSKFAFQVHNLQRYTAAEAEAEGGEAGPSHMCNPPFVHAVAVAGGAGAAAGAAVGAGGGNGGTSTGGNVADVFAARRLVAAACGDGTIAVVDVDLPAPGSSASSGSGGKGVDP
jgi:hypothetical protein